MQRSYGRFLSVLIGERIMGERTNWCEKCNGFGAYQKYVGGRVQRVYCDCEAGKKLEERVSKNNVESEE